MVRMERNEKKVYIHLQEKIDETVKRYNHTGAKEEKTKKLKEFFDFFAFMKTPVASESAKEVKEEEKRVGKNEGGEYFPALCVSIDDSDFFSIKNLNENIEASKGRLQTINGDYNEAPALFYYLLNKKNTIPKRIFFSYSHKDALFRKELETHFATLKRQGFIETWHDMEITPSEDWDKKIKDELRLADVVLLLLSSDFMNSSYIWEQEIPIAQREGKIIVPIFLRPCDFKGLNIGENQGAPFDANGGGIPWIVSTKWQYRDEAYLAVIEKM
jgi:hypothetical protein